MAEVTPKERFLESLDRCAEDEGFIPAFYDRFLSTSDEIQWKFMHTDFSRQNQMLLRSLRLAAGATAGEADALREIQERAVTHDRYHLNIEPRLYEVWLNSVIETARDFDKEWNSELEETWRTILGHVVSYMVRSY